MSIVNNPKLVNLIPDDDHVLNHHVGTLKWAVVKFISPENNIQKKYLYDLNRFLYNDVNKQLVDMSNCIVSNINNDFSTRLQRKIDSLQHENQKELVDCLTEIKKELKLDDEFHATSVLRQYRIDQQDLKDRFDTYCLENRLALERDFAREVTPQTSIRGFKVSGASEELAEARSRAKHVNQDIEPYIHSYVVPMGRWVPWDPNPDAIQDQEYMLDELNNLMGQYKENAEAKNEVFQKRKTEMIDKIREQNNVAIKDSIQNV